MGTINPISTNTSTLYRAVRDFTVKRAEAREAYIRHMRDIEDLEGSARYEQERASAAKTREQTVDAAAADARKVIQAAVSAMEKNARSMELKAPSDEQLRLLQLLSMRSRLSQNEVTQAANALGDCGAALEALRDVAAARGVQYPLIAFPENVSLSIDQAINTLKSICAGVDKVLNEKTGADPTRLLTAQLHQRHYGGDFDPDTFPAAKLYDSEQDFFSSLTSVSYPALCAAFNGKE